ncbi:MAG TPA: glycosyltransferase family 39 protein [Solirubrobacterales bacterium]|nr:glycosyltransferase family 39 protein [Solirubrobacterales bacterium]
MSEARSFVGSGLAQRNGGPVGLAILVAILLLGLGLRLDYAWDGREPVFDAAAYAEIAANLERGAGFTLAADATQPASNYSPGLPLLITGLYELTGGVHERTARIVLALLGTLSILFAYLIAYRLRRSMHRPQSGVSDASSVVAGLGAAAAIATYPALLEYQGMFMGEPLAATLLAGAVLAMLWAADKDGRAAWLLPGVLLGGLTLTRPEYLGVAVLVAVVVFARDRRAWRTALAQAGILLAGLVLVVAPWTVRNAIALDRFVPVSTGGGQVLFAGTYLPSDGDPEKVGEEVLDRHPGLTRRFVEDFVGQRSLLMSPSATNSERVAAVVERVRLEQILARLAAQRYPSVETDQALARMGREQLWNDINEKPVEYAGFVAAKVWRIWSQGPREVMDKPGWKVFHWLLVALGLLGFAALARQRRWEALLLATIFVSITAASALLVASPRRVLVMLPLVAALAGVGAVACRDSLARWNR